ncbi:putative Pre-mRNA-splicing factor SPP2 [Amylocarpus encephaloides]|uniref:Pre-mRNA-splicing factor n=1 Tax=Amylocarpus encephaloides TaxID=45428 RepID=A0A9P7YTK7_9HELO|nr:putative Pre-mRNA-splicing factor SPP2 [Amylocarpus encephaloides]
MSPSKDDPPSGTSTPKIPIKGFSLSSKSGAKPGAKPPPPSSLGKRPRSTFQSHDDSGSESESKNRNGGGNGRLEVVTGFGEGGAISRRDEERKREKEKVLVIPKMQNRDWRGGARAKKNLLPPEVQREREAAAMSRRNRDGGKAEGVDVVNSKDGGIKWGLTVRRREDVEVEGGVKGEKEDAEANVKIEEADDEKPRSADEEALAALLGQKKEQKGPDLVIPTTTNAEPEDRITEEDAYKRAIASAPDVSTLEDYERVPVEKFGAALLRGMGWKGEKQGKIRDVKRRQNLLGLGAKELKDAEELGAWVQKSDVRRLNERKGPSHSGHGARRPKASEYKRGKEMRDERREERGGGGYKRERERDHERDNSSRRYRDERDRDYDRRR